MGQGERAPRVDVGSGWRGRRWSLGALFAVDLGFIVLHVPQAVDLTDAIRLLPYWAEEVIFDRRWWMEMDGGRAERWGYVKTLATVR